MPWPVRDDLPVLCKRSYITVTTGAHGQIGFPDLWPLPRAVHFHGYWWGVGGEVWEGCVGGRRGDDFWGWHWCLTGLRGAVKTKPLINAIDQQKNRGKCDLHTARVINALTDFFFLLTPPPPLKSDFLSFQSEREREFRLMWIDWASLRQEYKAFY